MIKTGSMIMALIGVLTAPLSTRADAVADNTDKVAHFGLSYGINHMAYAGCKFGLKLNKPTCLISSIVLTSMVGIAKEVMDGDKNTAKEHGKDLASDFAGIGVSTLAITLTW